MTQEHKVIDLNADVGEADTAPWAWAEAQILATVSSANIACGGHAGDDAAMAMTIKACAENGVSIGAHPAYPDRENFGRRSFTLGVDISASKLSASLTAQIARLSEIAADHGVKVAYVKPHGALYNDAVINLEKAQLIADVIKSIDADLPLLGGPNSCMQRAAKRAGIGFVAEGFIDRRYNDQGHLLSRSQSGAVIKDVQERLAQAKSLAVHGRVNTASGRVLSIKARSLCLHGDSAGAVQTALQTRNAIEALGIHIKAFAA